MVLDYQNCMQESISLSHQFTVIKPVEASFEVSQMRTRITRTGAGWVVAVVLDMFLHLYHFDL